MPKPTLAFSNFCKKATREITYREIVLFLVQLHWQREPSLFESRHVLVLGTILCQLLVNSSRGGNEPDLDR